MLDQIRTFETDLKIQSFNIFENVFYSVVIDSDGRIFERITDGDCFNFN